MFKSTHPSHPEHLAILDNAFLDTSASCWSLSPTPALLHFRNVFLFCPISPNMSVRGSKGGGVCRACCKLFHVCWDIKPQALTRPPEPRSDHNTILLRPKQHHHYQGSPDMRKCATLARPATYLSEEDRCRGRPEPPSVSAITGFGSIPLLTVLTFLTPVIAKKMHGQQQIHVSGCSAVRTCEISVY